MYESDDSVPVQDPKPPFKPDDWRPAPANRRMAAAVVDFLVSIVLFYAIAYLIELIGSLWLIPLAFSSVIVYYVAVPWLLKETLGKAILRIRVVMCSSGQSPSIKVRTYRFLALIFSGDVNGFPLFRPSWLKSEERRRFGDRWAGTIVVDADPNKRFNRKSITGVDHIADRVSGEASPAEAGISRRPGGRAYTGIRLSGKPKDEGQR